MNRKLKILFATLLVIGATSAPTLANDPPPLSLVTNGQAQATVIVPTNATTAIISLANYFVNTVERSTGALLPIVTEAQVATIPATHTRLYVGPTLRAKGEGLQPQTLADEEYRIFVEDRDIIVLGRDVAVKATAAGTWQRESMPEPTRWGLNYILESQLGVRWLWPGELGTYVPPSNNLSVPAQNISYQPLLLVRELALGTLSFPLENPTEFQIEEEARNWAGNHEANKRTATIRSSFPMGHGFSDWWGTYGQTHPDYFVETPPGKAQPGAAYIKPRFSNPAVIEQIAQEYLAAGAPKYWNVAEQDGYFFDCSATARSWDIPANLSIDDIWAGRVNLTPRYVFIWNLISDRLRQINPDVILSAMAYSAYRQPPPPERPFTASMLIGMVVSYRAYDEWTGWRTAIGDGDMFLRPNWGWVGANAPHIPLSETRDYLHFAANNGMIGFRLDSIIGFWGTQGINYYLTARMLKDPSLTLEEILDEYTSAFGAGGPKIREYLDYWHDLTEEYAYSVSGDSPAGAYNDLVQNGTIASSGQMPPRHALIYLYPESVLEPAYELLDEARLLINDDNSEEAARVEFLRSGLDEMSVTRDLVAIARQVNAQSPPALIQQFWDKSNELDTLRETLSPHHVVWGKNIRLLEDRYPLPMRPQNMNLPVVDPGDW